MRMPLRTLLLTLLAAFSARSRAESAIEARAWRIGTAPEAQAALADSMRSVGFRPLSYDLYGDPARPLAAGAWARKAGPEWRLLRGLSAARLGDTLAALAPAGFRPAIVTGAGGDFSAIVERDTTPALALMDLDQAAFRGACDSAQRNGAILVSADAYGSPGRPLFAGVWKRNAAGTPWNYSIGDRAEGLPAKMDAFAPVWVRPALLLPMPGGRYFTLWQEGSVGAWAYRAGAAAKEAEAILAQEAGRGIHPLTLSGGPEAEPAFTFLMAARPEPMPKRWSTTGEAVPSLAAFDDYMRRLMTGNHVRAGALAVARGGRIVLSRGYTHAEEGYPLTQPDSKFRIASCSKPLTSILMHRLLRESGLPGAGFYLQEKVLSLLRRDGDSLPADPRFGEVTVDDLLTHAGGWARSRENPDPVFNDYPVGSGIRKRLPEDKGSFWSYMLRQPLQFAPGSRSSYANFGYFLLGRLIESAPMNVGKTYEQVAGDWLFKPLGLTAPRFGGSRIQERLDGEVLYHARIPYLQRNREPGGAPWVPGGYGDFDVRNMDAAGAWVLSAEDYARVLAAFDAPANPLLPPEAVKTMWSSPRNTKYLRGWFGLEVEDGQGRPAEAKWHNGLFPGTSTLVFHLPGHWSFALFLDRDLSPQLTGEVQGRALNRMAAQVSAWPGEATTELAVGMKKGAD